MEPAPDGALSATVVALTTVTTILVAALLTCHYNNRINKNVSSCKHYACPEFEKMLIAQQQNFLQQRLHYLYIRIVILPAVYSISATLSFFIPVSKYAVFLVRVFAPFRYFHFCCLFLELCIKILFIGFSVTNVRCKSTLSYY